MSTDQAKPVKRRPPARNVGAVEPPKGLDPFYIQASAPFADEYCRVLKQGEMFAVFDHFGDIVPAGMGEEGIYYEGTRFLSCLALKLGDDRPLFLSSTVKEDNGLLAVDMTNLDIRIGEKIAIARGTLHLFRAKFLSNGVCYERVRVRNYGLESISAPLTLHFNADFADIFEVRGTNRKHRGRYLSPIVQESCVILGYEGLDGVVRRARLEFSPAPAHVWESGVCFNIGLGPKTATTCLITVSCEVDGHQPADVDFDKALSHEEQFLEDSRSECCDIKTTNEHFAIWLRRTVADLHMMTTATPEGPYPYAGVPWFSTPFGRDGIITALECLWINPEMARGVLAYLAATQARDVIPERDAEPGKILHEARGGEMAKLGEVPFGRYYGSVDSTPLFILLAGAYYERTADRQFIDSIWPNIELALKWIDNFGDADGDGFVEYARKSNNGLENQGWKDSHDSVFHADGSMANGPIALCEVQAYVYGAKCRAAELATALGLEAKAKVLVKQAKDLQERFEQAYWCDELSTYALALDGDKRPCRVRTSNAGQCLFTCIASAERAALIEKTMLSEQSYTGWGIRTVASNEVRYNPMSYHNGSVWPHDNALIGFGLSRYGLMDGVLKIMTGLYDASQLVDLQRLPELFCGFNRRPGEGPTLYPVACSPQSWAAASVFLMMQACLGMHIVAPESRISLHHPVLPEFLREVEIRNLKLGDASMDLLLRRHRSDISIDVLRKDGKADIAIVKKL